jgi:hypothetical protein
MDDCIQYKKGREVCQKLSDVQTAPTNELHPIVKPWPIRGWGLDFIVEIHPSSLKGHWFVFVATNYFTKWTKTVPLRNMTHKEVINLCRNT